MLKSKLSSHSFPLFLFIPYFDLHFLGMSFLDIIPRNSHWRCSLKTGVLKNFTNFPEKHLCWSLFLIKLHSFRPANLSNETLTSMFSWKISKQLLLHFFSWLHKNTFLWLFKVIFKILYLQRNLTKLWCFIVVTLEFN